jgi:hypothetical protein
MYAVKINPNVYDISSGEGIPERQYYCVDERGSIALSRVSSLLRLSPPLTTPAPIITLELQKLRI